MVIRKEFVQILVDYISVTHFGLYEGISSGTERRHGVDQLAQDLYPKIASALKLRWLSTISTRNRRQRKFLKS